MNKRKRITDKVLTVNSSIAGSVTSHEVSGGVWNLEFAGAAGSPAVSSYVFFLVTQYFSHNNVTVFILQRFQMIDNIYFSI